MEKSFKQVKDEETKRWETDVLMEDDMERIIISVGEMNMVTVTPILTMTLLYRFILVIYWIDVKCLCWLK